MIKRGVSQCGTPLFIDETANLCYNTSHTQSYVKEDSYDYPEKSIGAVAGVDSAVHFHRLR